MSRLPRKVLAAWPVRLRPSSWPVRWRLAGVSAGLTLVILVVFGAVIGQVATSRIRDDFNRQVSSAAQTLAAESRIFSSLLGTEFRGPKLDDFVRPDGASARVFSASGSTLTLIKESSGAEPLGSPADGLSNYHEMRVATARITGDSGEVSGFVQYGRSLAHVDSTVDRLWLFIGAGIIGGTLLASLAGVAIAARAMRPISALTATARQIGVTGDPSRRMPDPKADDEVGELARTLEQMLRSLDAARTEREAAMKKQREFVADASHELRTPLTSVLANLELLQSSLQPRQEEDRAMVDSALRSSRRMSRLVGDLLLLARSDAGRTSKRRPCDLAEVAGNAAAEVAPVLGDREIEIENNQAIAVEGNPDELHRMVLNLLDNAGRHTPPGARIQLRLHAEANDAVVEVADDGPGIPAQIRAQIFDRFVRGEGPADTAVGPGSGLGLAIVRAVATSHGGTVEVAESERGGALFRVRLPLSRSQQTVTTALEPL
jgi:two-component system OmpR family sensor kinase